MWVALTAQHLEQACDNQHDLFLRYFDYQYKPEIDMKTHIANTLLILWPGQSRTGRLLYKETP